MKTVWKGTLSFGLVNIPIELYSAVQSHSLGFKLLHEKCHTPISYQRWCTHCKQEVQWGEIVKGIKLPDDTYFILTKENLQKLKPEKTDSINVIEFIKSDTVEKIYFDQHYYVTPSKATEKAFFLFIAALKDLSMVAIGQFVMRDKEYVCMIEPYKTGMLLTTLNYEYEIRKLSKFDELEAKPKISSAELKLAEQLINKLESKKFSMERFKDTFAENLKKKIKLASKGEKIPEREKPVRKRKEEAPLMEALRASLMTPGTKHNGHAPSRKSR